VTQPVREPIDLDRGEAEILAETEAFCRSRPGFRPMAEWQQVMAARLAASAES
jgi:catechol 2,3-dioxygenase